MSTEPRTLADVLAGGRVVPVAADGRSYIMWNRSATFTVYSAQDDGRLALVDTFTNYDVPDVEAAQTIARAWLLERVGAARAALLLEVLSGRVDMAGYTAAGRRLGVFDPGQHDDSGPAA
ncbi:hypothetical protein ACTHQ1_05135 [Janibacter anophelis]|uniref:hypothetical protein n=1 Tax=Janibacter anophelis TaxID=319054 RepID=UPI003F80EEF9